MKVSIYTIAYNEEVLLPHFIRHYKQRFPECKITVYDNESTDNTTKIARESGCTVISYKTDNKLNDQAYLDIKNNCWKGADGWVIICDCDEFLDISEEQLLQEEQEGTTMILAAGYNMVNMEDNSDIENMKMGVRDSNYDKSYMFDARKIEEINYYPGCHDCRPQGSIFYSSIYYLLYHYKFINPDYIVNRYRMFRERLSDINKERGWGVHYNDTETAIREQFKNLRNSPDLVKLL